MILETHWNVCNFTYTFVPKTKHNITPKHNITLNIKVGYALKQFIFVAQVRQQTVAKLVCSPMRTKTVILLLHSVSFVRLLIIIWIHLNSVNVFYLQVFGIICMSLASPAYLSGTHWFLFVVTISFIGTLIWTFVYLLGIREALNLHIDWLLSVSKQTKQNKITITTRIISVILLLGTGKYRNLHCFVRDCVHRSIGCVDTSLSKIPGC